MASNLRIERISPELLTDRRMLKRSAGLESNYETKTFLVAGIGSIGSNLVHFLNSYLPEFVLIDPEFLKIENIGRHLLGYEHINQGIAEAVEDYLKAKLPTQKVTSESTSLIKVFESKYELIKSSDFMFIAIGQVNIENWVAEKNKDR